MKLNFKKLGEGQPLIILHGLFGLLDNWQGIGKILSESFTVYLVDLRNHGNSPHSDEWNYKVMSGDIKELCDNEGIHEGLILMGHSMGGKTAMQFAMDHCEMLNKLIVVDIAPRVHEPPMDVLKTINSLDLAGMTSRKSAETELSKTISDNGTIQFLLKNLYWKTDTELDWKFNLKTITENISMISDVPQGKRCEVATLFIRGERSEYIREQDRQQIMELFPDASIESVSNAGHWVHAENPKEFLEVLRRFIG